MEAERKEFEWTDIKVIIEKRKKQTPKMKNVQVHAFPKRKHKGTATCNIGVTAMNQECQTQHTGIDVITQTPEHGIEEEIKRENQKLILAEQRIKRLKAAKEAEKKAAEKRENNLRAKKALDEAKLEKEENEKKLQEETDKTASKKGKKKKKKSKDFRDNIVALDCEMVGVGKKGRFSVLARACVVSGHGEVLIDQYCSSDRKVTDYRTWISGIEERHMNTAQSFYKLKQKVNNAIAGKIVVGHGLSHDFQALRLNHPEHMKRDSAEYFRGKFEKKRRPPLKILAKDQLGIEIQEGSHSPVIDAKAALDIYLKNREEWEAKDSKSTNNKENIPKNKTTVEKIKPQSIEEAMSSVVISRPSEYDESDIDDELIFLDIDLFEFNSDDTTDSEEYGDYLPREYFPGLRENNTDRGDYNNIMGSGLFWF